MSSHQRQSSAHSKPRPVPTPTPSSIPTRGRSPAEGSVSRATSIARLGSPVPSHSLGSPAVRQVPTLGELATGETAEAPSPLAGLEGAKSSLPGPGESALANALRGSFGRSPPRFGTPPTRPLSPATAATETRGPRSTYGSFEPRSTDSPMPYEDPEIIRRHLAGPANNSSSNLAGQNERGGSTNNLPDQGGARASPRKGSVNAGPGFDIDEFSSLRLQGGDITRQIYRWTEQQEAELQRQGKARRSHSFHMARPRAEEETMDIGTIKQPGGFRRDHLRRAAASPARSSVEGGPSRMAPQPRAKPVIITNNFIEFLSLYGHFAGEELGEDDDEEADEYFSSGTYGESGADGADEEDGWQPGEETALLTPSRKKRKMKAKAAGNSAGGAALMLLKSFVGTGVLFLPRAFLNGGMLFSNLVLLFVAALSYYCFLLLVSTRLEHPVSYGDMGMVLYGTYLRNAINISLVISQVGFASAYIVFTSENLQAFILAVSKCRTYIDIKYMILMQMAIFLPLSLYRRITTLQTTALIADVFIVLGLVYLYYYDIHTMATQHGVADIALFNKNDWTLFIGTAIFTFEGIGLIIPIQEGMKHPKKFPSVLAGVMVLITVVFTSMGALSYAAYGSKTKTVIILNMPQDSKMVNGVQFIYSLAILLSTPLQFFPAIEITSKQIFKRTGKDNPFVKWKKNFFRFCMVVLCALIAWVGANDLDKFVALVGSFACIPLVYIYPPMMHFKAVAQTRRQKIADVALCIFGAAVMAYTTVLTVMSWIRGGDVRVPRYCDDK